MSSLGIMSGAVERAPHSGGEARLKLRRPELYINREVAAVRFIRRVFEQAQSERHPLLERVKFLAFVGSQIDEFLMVRYAGTLRPARSPGERGRPGRAAAGANIRAAAPDDSGPAARVATLLAR